MKLQKLMEHQDQLVNMIVEGTNLYDILDILVRIVEFHSESGAICSVLLADKKTNTLKHGAAPSLPKDFIKAIDVLPIGPKMGSCGTAAYYKKTVIVSNIETDPLWENYRDSILPSGFKACWSSPIIDKDGSLLGTFALYYDQIRTASDEDYRLINKITNLASLAISRNNYDKQLHTHENYDRLTSLPNRHLLKNYLDTQITGKFSQAGFLLLDIDRFQVVNNSLGYIVGDQLLKAASARLEEAIGRRDCIFRYGSDEFIIILEGKSCEEISLIAQDLIHAFEEPFIIDQHQVFVGASIGISLYPFHGDKVKLLVTNANYALAEAKKVKNTFEFYNPSDNQFKEKRVELEMNIRKALLSREFHLAYQPQVCLKNNIINGLEALLRWVHPTLGTVSPRDFIPLLEDTGLIIPVGEWILTEACTFTKSLHEKGYTSIVMSVNISIRQFYQPNFVSMVAKILKETELSPKYLHLEITESMTMDVERTIPIINDLKKLGVKVAIDDFGTGYSSLSILKKLPIDCLKIDQSFINDITSDNDKDRDIVTTIIKLGQGLKLDVIAEGVETKEQLDFLEKQSCYHIQGYYYSKPLPSTEIDQFLFQWGGENRLIH